VAAGNNIDRQRWPILHREPTSSRRCAMARETRERFTLNPTSSLLKRFELWQQIAVQLVHSIN